MDGAKAFGIIIAAVAIGILTVQVLGNAGFFSGRTPFFTNINLYLVSTIAVWIILFALGAIIIYLPDKNPKMDKNPQAIEMQPNQKYNPAPPNYQQAYSPPPEQPPVPMSTPQPPVSQPVVSF